KAQTRAINLLTTIPLADHEREQAVDGARWAIEYTDITHNDAAPIIGIVSRTAGNRVIAIRWKHTSINSLEVASERVIEEASKAATPTGLFLPPQGRVSIREPHKAVDIYHGDVLHSPNQRWQQARTEKSAEFLIAIIAFVVAVAGIVAGPIVYFNT